MSDYYIKSDIDASIVAYAQPKGNYLTEHQSLENYATKNDISAFLTQHQDISGKADKSELFSGDYNDLTNKPTIPTVDLTKSQADTLYQPKGTYLTEHQSLNNYYTKQDTYSKTETDNAISTAVANIPTSGNQVQSDLDYNADRNNLAYVKNKPVGIFKVTLVKELTDVIMSYSSYSYYYISALNQINKHIKIDDNKWGYANCYPSEVYSTLLTDSNGEMLNEAPEWLAEDTRFIIEVDGKKVLCNSGNERNWGIKGQVTATASIKKYTCEYDSDGNKLDTPKDVYDVYINFSEWLTQSLNVSSLKLYRVDDTSDTEMCLSWYDINHVYFYDKEEVNNRITSPDWNINDVTSPTFIVNKPFGTLKGNSYIFSGNNYYYHYASNKLNDGRYYTYMSSFNSSDFWLKKNHVYYVYFNDELYGTIQPQEVSNSNMVITSNLNSNNNAP